MTPGLLVLHLQTLLPASEAGFDLAFLIHKGTIHWSARKPASLHEPHSAITDLIQGLFQRLHDQSFFALRQRIFTSAKATELDRAMIKVAAKRFTDLCAANDTELAGNFTDHTLLRETPAAIASLASAKDLWSGDLPTTDEDWLKLCARLADSVERGQVLHKYHRPLAALIVDANGGLLGAATHEGAFDKTQHAELRAVQSWFTEHGKALPKGTRIYASLKPCRMCAAALVHISDEPQNLRVIYLNDDPGSHAQNTALSLQVEQKSASALTVVEGETEGFSKSSRSPRRD